MMLDKADVVILGAGIVGTTSAFFLSQVGHLRVIVVERDGPAYGASGRSGGGVRQQRRSPAELHLAEESVRLWRYFSQVEKAPFEYQQKGNIQVAVTPADVEALTTQARQEKSMGLDVEFLSAKEIREIEPSMSDEIYGGNYCASDGDVNPILATRYFASRAQRNGAVFYRDTSVTGIATNQHTVTGVVTSRGVIGTDTVVSAIGPWTSKLLEMLKVRLPILPRRTQALITVPVFPLVRTFVGGNTVYIRQTATGTLLLGGGGDWEAVGFDTSSSLSFLRRVARRSTQLIPFLKEIPVVRAWSGIADMTPDHTAIIGPLDEWPRIFVAAGFNGHGFATGIGTGRVMADLVTEGSSPISLEGLSPGRFSKDIDYFGHYRQTPEPI